MASREHLGRPSKRRALLAGLLLTAAWPMAKAMAQTAPPGAPANSPASASSGSAQMSEVVVTARGRSENLMRVPDTITAFTATQITNRQLTTIDDFVHLTPNAKIIREQDIATSELYIRGVGSNKGQASAIAYVVDGVILPTPDAYTIDLSDAQSVEILKGPQGALYGKGALAGVVNIHTLEPSLTPRFDAKFDVGSDNTYGLYASVSGPLDGDVLLGQLNFKFNKTDGDFLNHYNNTGIERNEDYRLSGKLIYQPNDIFKVEYAGTYYTERSGNPPYNGVDVLGTGSAEITSAEAAAPIYHNSPDTDRRKVFSSSVIVTASYPFGTFTSTTAFDRVDFAFAQDTDFTALNVFSAAETRYSRGVSQEIRFTSPSDKPLRYILDAYYDNTQDNRVINGYGDFCFLGITTCGTPPGVLTGVLTQLPLQNTKVNTNDYAVSGQVNYDILKSLELTLALRYDANTPVQSDYLHDVLQTTTFSDWSPKASLAYKPTRDLTVYATYSHGYKPGLFNPPQAPGSPFPVLVKQEGTNNVEVGLKAAALDNRLHLDLAAFHTNYANAQEFHLDVQSGGNQAINVNKSVIDGYEIEVEAYPIHSIDIDASFGYTRSRIVNFNDTSAYVGQSLPYQPRYTLNLGGQYTRELPDDLTFIGRIDYTRDGRTSFQDFQNPDTNQFLYQNSDQTVDVHATLRRGPWALEFYGKNILNAHYVYSAYSRYISALIFAPLHEDVLLPAPGATFGGELRVDF